MAKVIQNIQVQVKSTSHSVGLILFKLIVGLFVGLTLSLIGQEIIGYDNLAFIFVIVVTAGIIMHKTRSWGYGGVLIFCFICLLIGALLRMYIQVAPGA